MVEMAMLNIQRAITPRRLILLYICVKFREKYLERVIERTRMMEALTDGRIDGRTDLKLKISDGIIPSPHFMAGHKMIQQFITVLKNNKKQSK